MTDASNCQLHDAQLEKWIVNDELATAEAWLEGKRRELAPENWCILLSDWARHLAFADHHAQAEEWLRSGVRQYPDNLRLLGQLAELVQVQGRIREAMALLRRAIEVASGEDEQTFTLWLRLSATALPVNPPLAKFAAEQANDSLVRLKQTSGMSEEDGSEQTLQLELARANCEARSDTPKVAEARYQQILEQQSQQPRALQGLGELMLQLGRIDEAIELFDRLKAADAGQGYGALMRVRRFPNNVETLNRLEQVARTPGFEGSVRTGLLFQLAAAWENRRCYDKAFALAEEANDAARRMLSYNPDQHRQRCARIRHAYPKALYQHRNHLSLIHI